MLRATDRQRFVGDLAYEAINPQQVSVQSGKRRIINVGSREFGALAHVAQTASASANGAWVSANDPLALPITFWDPVVITQLGWVNGSAAGGGVDFGIYDASWNRMVSTGAQTGTGNSSLQMIDVTDTPIGPGRYWAVMSRDNTTASRQLYMATTASVPLMAFLGCQDSATDAYPLPNPLTNMAVAATFTRIPNLQISTR